ncbi:ATP-binding cassette domain-containing protein [Facklamia miroungae]|uniref:ATP-binding cassette, subfamily B n=1 Tax=Facklamia miroungae TaxID=120956 RepID=A0A1G7VCJ2_9LACT|nr:ABC transporter ATP-binding protein [Facklamia miroungae]NKZ30297.1 ABC transporter ATP-binding protein [Facklamia miroungae]SDG57437.1 ATP-binding cassette, subfamily B [Facklamia miroungae]
MKLKNYIIRNISLSIQVLALIILGQICMVFWGFSISNLITYISSKNTDLFFTWLIFMIIDLVIWMVQIYISKIKYHKLIQKINIQIRQDIATKLFRSSYQNFYKKDEGTYVSWLTNDITIINEYGFGILYLIISQISGIVFSFIATVYFDASLIITMLVLSFIVLYVPSILKNKMQKRMKDVSIANESLTNNITDVLQGYDSLKMMNLEKYMVNRINLFSQNLANKQIAYATITGKLMSLTNGVSLTSQIILFSQSALLYFNNIIPIGAINGVQYFSATIFSSLTGLSANIIELKTIDPIFEKFENIVEDISNNLISINELTSSIEMRNVSYEFNNNKVLHQIDLSFKKNKKYVIVGDSGKGKSTLLNLISGKLTDYSGEIIWDNIPYNKIAKSTIQNQIIYINQNPYIFNASIRENLTLLDSFSDEEIQKVIKDVGLYSWISELEHGLDTIISLNAKNISGGQKQRIALARGLLKNKSIILLDEPTSALDEFSANDIENLIFNNEKLTVIMVTHRLRNNIKQLIDEIITLE